MENAKKINPARILTIFIIASLFFVFLTGYTKFIFAKDYTFYIETECDPENTACFVRDCNESCPPNGLSVYSAYYIRGTDFQKCTSSNCSNICQGLETAHLCKPILCDTNAGDECI